MKIWNSYGSEHSANLVMIGTFKTVEDAKKAKAAIDALVNFVNDSNEEYMDSTHYTDKQMELYREGKIHGISHLAPHEFFHFRHDISLDLYKTTIKAHTDELDISAYLKVMIDHGAKMEVYSAHDYPDTETDDSEIEE